MYTLTQSPLKDYHKKIEDRIRQLEEQNSLRMHGGDRRTCKQEVDGTKQATTYTDKPETNTEYQHKKLD